MPSHVITFFAIIGVLAVVGSINSVQDDFVDEKLVGLVFFGDFVVVCLRVLFLLFVGKDVVQQLFTVIRRWWSFLLICLDRRQFPTDRH